MKLYAGQTHRTSSFLFLPHTGFIEIPTAQRSIFISENHKVYCGICHPRDAHGTNRLRVLCG